MWTPHCGAVWGCVRKGGLKMGGGGENAVDAPISSSAMRPLPHSYCSYRRNLSPCSGHANNAARALLGASPSLHTQSRSNAPPPLWLPQHPPHNCPSA